MPHSPPKLTQVPAIMFWAIACPSDQILPSVATAMRVDYFFHKILFEAFGSEYGLGLCEFALREEVRIIWEERFELGCMEG
jgi:hypothetical protein